MVGRVSWSKHAWFHGNFVENDQVSFIYASIDFQQAVSLSFRFAVERLRLALNVNVVFCLIRTIVHQRQFNLLQLHVFVFPDNCLNLRTEGSTGTWVEPGQEWAHSQLRTLQSLTVREDAAWSPLTDF